MDIRRVAIIGRGALGLLHAHLISRVDGLDAVTFVMDDDRLATCSPVLINGEPCEVACASPEQTGPVDLVIVATKASGLEQAIQMMRPLMRPDTRVISLLNGITSEGRIADVYGWDGVVSCVAQGMDAVFVAGELTYVHPGELRIGAERCTAEALADVDAYLTHVGVAHTVEDDIQHRLWTKWMLNVGVNQTCAVYSGTYASVSAPGEQNRVFVSAMREVIAVATAEGINVGEDDLSAMASLMASLTPEGMPSMAQDRINGKPSEVDEFSGALIERAERHGILVPTNRFLNDSVHAYERQMGLGA